MNNNIKTTTAKQRGAAISNWARHERQRDQGKMEDDTPVSPSEFSLKPTMQESDETNKWAKPKRPLMDGGQGKHTDFDDREEPKARRRKISRAMHRRRRRRRAVNPTTDSMTGAASDVREDVTLPHVLRDVSGAARDGSKEKQPAVVQVANADTSVQVDQVANADNSGPTQMAPLTLSPDKLGGLETPRLATGAGVTGSSKEQHRKENKILRQQKQAEQPATNYWSQYQGQFAIPTPKQAPSTWRNNMCPSGLALHHPAAELLLKYATEGCPTDTGEPWSIDQMTKAVERGPHQSALDPEAMEYFEKEVMEKVAQGQARVVLWDDIKDAPPPQLKVSPIALIPHKSRMFRAILDLSSVICNPFKIWGDRCSVSQFHLCQDSAFGCHRPNGTFVAAHYPCLRPST